MKVLKITSVIFVLLVIILAVLMWKSKAVKVWPPEISQCPDYWEKEIGSGKCKDTHQIYPKFGGGSSPDFSQGTYSGYEGMKKKCSWANQYNIHWTGITDANPSLCD